MKEQTNLIEFGANSFLGIDSDGPVVIDFTEARKNQNVTMLRGDQGVGKTSTLYAIMALMGAAFNFDTKNLYNQKDDNININLSFEHEGAKYEATQVGNRLTLKRYYKETDRWIAEGSPKETLRKIFGNLGISPMFLKDLSGKEQIKWFKTTFGADEEVTKKEQKLQKNLDDVFSQRREVRREMNEQKGWLSQNEMYKNYEKNLKKFAEPINVEKEKKAFEEITAKNRDFEKNKNGLSSLKEDHDDITIRIQKLRKELEAAEELQKGYQVRIDAGEKWLDAHKHIPVEYEKANKEWLNLSKTMSDQTQWKEVLRKEKLMHDNEDAVVQADASIDKLRSELLKLTSTYLPNIKGLEIRTKGMNIDNEDEDEGLFYQGKSLAQLSESELSALFLLIWKAKKVFFIFIENISSYGSGFVKLLNDLVKSGEIRVFATQMDRKKKAIEISFETKID